MIDQDHERRMGIAFTILMLIITIVLFISGHWILAMLPVIWMEGSTHRQPGDRWWQ